MAFSLAKLRQRQGSLCGFDHLSGHLISWLVFGCRKRRTSGCLTRCGEAVGLGHGACDPSGDYRPGTWGTTPLTARRRGLVNCVVGSSDQHCLWPQEEREPTHADTVLGDPLTHDSSRTSWQDIIFGAGGTILWRKRCSDGSSLSSLSSVRVACGPATPHEEARAFIVSLAECIDANRESYS